MRNEFYKTGSTALEHWQRRRMSFGTGLYWSRTFLLGLLSGTEGAARKSWRKFGRWQEAGGTDRQAGDSGRSGKCN